MQKEARYRTIKRLALILTGSVIFAFNLNTFVHAGSLIPGGFTGLALLVQECCLRFAGVYVPFSIINYAFNAVPAFISFKFIGK
ncbi:MAG: YitT family protein, partial [Treponema sp.]|nr:YitT family protein [Treponema sp.]